jgi:hypothetical protein
MLPDCCVWCIKVYVCMYVRVLERDVCAPGAVVSDSIHWTMGHNITCFVSSVIQTTVRMLIFASIEARLIAFDGLQVSILWTEWWNSTLSKENLKHCVIRLHLIIRACLHNRCEKQLLNLLFLSVCPSEYTEILPPGKFWWNLYLGFLTKFVDMFWFWFKSDTSNRHFTWRPLYGHCLSWLACIRQCSLCCVGEAEVVVERWAWLIVIIDHWYLGSIDCKSLPSPLSDILINCKSIGKIQNAILLWFIQVGVLWAVVMNCNI